MRGRKKSNKHLLLLLVLIIIAIGAVVVFKKSNTKDSNDSKTQEVAQEISEQESTQEVAAVPQTPSPVESLTADEIEQSKKKGLPVLMYHFFYDAEAGEKGKDANFMEIHDFEEQIKYLTDNNYYVPTWKEVLGYVEGKNGLPLKSIVITVDDGDDSFFRLASPVLEKYNIRATSFLITSWYASIDHTIFHPHIDFQSHTHNMHEAGSNGKGKILTISHDEGVKDLETSRETINRRINEDMIVFCYPFGHYNDNAKKIIKDANYILAFTTEYGKVFPGQDPLVLPRIRMQKGDSLNGFINKIN